VMALFELPSIRRLGPSVRWLPARLAFSLLVAGSQPRRTTGRRPGPEP